MKATIANIVLPPGTETHLPIGPLHVVSSFEAAGFSVDFRDYQLARKQNALDLAALVEFLETPAPVLGISCYFNLLPLVVLAARQIKKQDPGKLILLGGAGPSAAGTELMHAFDWVDIIARGESEGTLSELLPRLGGDLHGVAGILFRDGQKVISNVNRERIADLDSLPGPAYHAVDLSQYSCVAINTARGCPFNCRFCAVSPLWGCVTHNRSIENVLEEIDTLHRRHGIDYVRIADDTMTLSRRRTLAFSAAMKERLPGVRWSCLARLDLVDEALLRNMAEGGCIGIQYGIESGAPSVLKRVSRPYSTETVLQAVSLSAQYMDHVVCSFIWGFPFETLDDFFMTMSLMARVAELGADIKLVSLMPAHLSSLYEEFGAHLSFDEEIAADTVYSGYSDEEGVDGSEALDRLLDLIRSYPRVFPEFYYFSSDSFAEKRAMLRRLRLA